MILNFFIRLARKFLNHADARKISDERHKAWQESQKVERITTHILSALAETEENYEKYIFCIKHLLTRDDVFQLAEILFFIFMEQTNVDKKQFIEDDPNNKGGTRSTEYGMELFADIEHALLSFFKIEL